MFARYVKHAMYCTVETDNITCLTRKEVELAGWRTGPRRASALFLFDFMDPLLGFGFYFLFSTL